MRQTRSRRVLIGLALALGASAFMPQAVASGNDGATLHAVVRNVSNAQIGTIVIQATRDGKLIIAGRVTGLTPGFHGFHIHAVGLCNPAATDPTGAPVPFFTAGGHLNPGGAGHGNHAGDLPVLLVARDGTARAVTETTSVTVAQILDADGSAFIVHAGPDNLANIPARYSAAGVPGPDAATLGTGDSGGRVACGVITRS
jgi:Cu-Zn family superoxide dismutase